MKINLQTLGLMLIIALSSCKHTANYQHNIAIPETLKSNTEAVKYIHKYNDVITEYNKLTQQIVIATEGKDISANTELSAAQKLELAKTVMSINRLNKKLEEAKTIQANIEQNLSGEELNNFKLICNDIASRMGQLDTSLISNSKRDLIAYQNKVQQKQQRDQKLSDSINALRNEAIKEMPDDLKSLYEHENETKEETPLIVKLLFVTAFISFWAYVIYRIIKKGKSAIKDIGYSVGEIKDNIRGLNDLEDKHTSNGKSINNREKQGIDLLNKFLK